ncbi:hypothetical protein BATDEDRAFT_92216 [Batrachochytrium dendrobatidis JAM81]|uniref:Uncharacterized protein n=2 Tax=Batrachochytrium dendrobatidis TaxID=109871 RepID=F4PD30_BATDJ|nr:uncharacterized protein BATDEDRAFT_92216 [Batrachochytrium dendrobatidis JAM81]EGF77021.1 hypothetical protein BATDEDRAFT_92216 [Batrachochytrium dendrobatidis JAM81]OAJ45089.1 hypothetical protein BDEG_28254 [Batrachochytrium dendrobatidis JEL423]|eukprot:XP_006682544.1 hypothetical protein BATDEDRAFT_92216 [Batrachochytrium dendrobatidis JAM81]
MSSTTCNTFQPNEEQDVLGESGTVLWHYWRAHCLKGSLQPSLQPCPISTFTDKHDQYGDTTVSQDMQSITSLVYDLLDLHSVVSTDSSSEQQLEVSLTISKIVMIDATVPSILFKDLHLPTPFVSRIQYVQAHTASDIVAYLYAICGLIKSKRVSNIQSLDGPVVYPCVILYARSPMLWIRMRSHEFKALHTAINHVEKTFGVTVVCWFLRNRDRIRWKSWLTQVT